MHAEAVAGWTAVLGGACVAGIALVGTLVLPRAAAVLPLAAFVFATSVSWAGLMLIAFLPSPRQALAAGLLGTGALLLGWAVGASWVVTRFVRRRTASIPPPTGDGCAILLYACAEPERYDPAALGAVLADLADTGAPTQSDIVMPLVFASERARYRSVGVSPARVALGALPERIAGLLPQELRVEPTMVYCEDEPLEARLAELARNGVSRVLVAPVSVAPPLHLTLAQARLDPMTCNGLDVLYARQLSDSKVLSDMVVGRVLAAAVGRHKTGVMLLTGGQPPEWVDSHPDAYRYEVFFVQRVRSALVEAGFDERRVRHAWLEWHEPGVAEVARHLGALGSREILLVPATIPSERLSTLIDVPVSLAQARLPEDIDVTTLSPWGEDEAVAQALAEAISQTLRKEA